MDPSTDSQGVIQAAILALLRTSLDPSHYYLIETFATPLLLVLSTLVSFLLHLGCGRRACCSRLRLIVFLPPVLTVLALQLYILPFLASYQTVVKTRTDLESDHLRSCVQPQQQEQFKTMKKIGDCITEHAMLQQPLLYETHEVVVSKMLSSAFNAWSLLALIALVGICVETLTKFSLMQQEQAALRRINEENAHAMPQHLKKLMS